jgi:hypothetical protein
MDILALFSDGTTEKIIISSISHKCGEKGLILRSTIKDKSLKESAEHVITNTYNYLLMKFPDNPRLLSTISICILGFSGKVVGNSADLAFSLAFIGYLVKEGILNAKKDTPITIAATGTVNDRLEIGKISNLESKIYSLKQTQTKTLYLPYANNDELIFLQNKQVDLQNLFDYVQAEPVKTLDDVLVDLGLVENTRNTKSDTSEYTSKTIIEEKVKTRTKVGKFFFGNAKFIAVAVVILAIQILLTYTFYKSSASSTSSQYSTTQAVTTNANDTSGETKSTQEATKNLDNTESANSITEEEANNNEPIEINWENVKESEVGKLYCITYGNGVFIAAGEGTIKKSTDGETWTTIKANIVSTIKSIKWYKDKFYAVGFNGMIITSKDGTKWTLEGSPTTWNLLGIAFSGKQYVAVGGYGTVLTSTNSAAWILGPRISDYYLSSVIWGNGKFVTVDYSGYVYTSRDGLKWIPETSISGITVEDIKYINGKFYATGNSGVIVSKDAISWESIKGSDISESINAITKAKNTFVAVGSHGTVLTSENGNDWQKKEPNINYSFEDVAYSNNAIVAVGYTEGENAKNIILRGKISRK